MNLTDWKIIYTKFEGISQRAISLLSKEIGGFMLRVLGEYRILVLPCEKEGCAVSKNAFLISRYRDSAIIPKLVSEEEVPEGGFLVKVIKNPENEDGRLVILTSNEDEGILHAVISFLDDYIPKYAPFVGSNLMPDQIFDTPLTECAYSEVPDNKRRCIFTWGHSFNSYRNYIENMARMRFNELILWNDYIPININDIIDYAHSFGIKVVLGYSWGWKEIGNKTLEITDEKIENVKNIAISEYINGYSKIKCDGIYFQSFTERQEESVGGRLISSIVVDMVNDIANRIWEISPDLRIIFGLHATSVRNRLAEIAKVDPRMEIMWEDCGEFPFSYASCVKDMDEYNKTLDFVKEILELRGGRGVGFLFKGVMMLDWTKVVRQSGPYVMGENSEKIAYHDKMIRKKAWKAYASAWMVSGKYALDMVRHIKKYKLGEVDIGIAGTFDGGLYLPVALCAEMYRNCDDSFDEILKRTAQRDCIDQF